MVESVYKIRKAFLLPLSGIIALLFVLFLLSVFTGQMWEIIIITVIFLVSLVIGVEMTKRKVIVDDQGVKIQKAFRRKEINWSEITHLAVVVLKKKAYFLLTTTKGFYIFSNLLENHASLVNSLADKLGEEKVEVEVRNYLAQPLERFSMIVMSWFAVAVIVALIILKISAI